VTNPRWPAAPRRAPTRRARRSRSADAALHPSDRGPRSPEAEGN